MTVLSQPKKESFSSRRRLGWIGVDVGTSAIKLAQVERAGQKWRLASSLIVPTGDDADRAAEDGPDRSVAQIVQSALKDSVAFRGRRAAFVLPPSEMEFRTLTLPAGTEDELRTMVGQELSSSSADSSAERLFDFWEIGLRDNSEKDGMCQLSVLSISRQAACRAAEQLLSAGLACQVLDGLPFALARAVALDSGTGVPTPVVALDWGFTSVTFVVVVVGRPAFVRSFRNCGVGRIVQSLSDGLGLSPRECRQMLVHYGVAQGAPQHCETGLQRAIYDLAAEPIASLVDDIEKTFSCLRRQRSELIPDRILLFGGGAAIRNADALLASRIDLPVNQWRPASLESANPPESETSHHAAARIAMLGPAAALSALAFES